MTRKIILFSTLLLCSSLSWGKIQSDRAKLTDSFKINPAQGSHVITKLLIPIRQQYKLPAVAAALVNAKGIMLEGVVGVRKNGTLIPATLHDKWMLGSNMKSMTATLVGRLVDLHKLNWNSTIQSIFPQRVSKFTPLFREITVEELLSQYAGLPRDIPGLTLKPQDWKKFKSQGSIIQQRLRILEYFGKRKLPYKPGTHKQYSNVGYIILGAVIEKVTGITYEQAMKKYVFKPLHMNSASFERGNLSGKITEPFSHFYNGEPTTITLPHLMDPGGSRIYMTMTDWSKFISDQIRGGQGKPGLLRAATYKKIQKPVSSGQALGFQIRNGALYHTGTDLLNVAIEYININKGFAVLYCTNIGFDIKTAPDNDDDIPVVKAGLLIIKKLSSYYVNSVEKA